jgi:hypothetical protein
LLLLLPLMLLVVLVVLVVLLLQPFRWWLDASGVGTRRGDGGGWY